MSDDLGKPATPFHYHLELTQPQLKITDRALRELRDEFVDEDSAVRAVIEEILQRLPAEAAMRAVRVEDELADELEAHAAERAELDDGNGPPPAAA